MTAMILLPRITLAADREPNLLLPLMAVVALGASAASGIRTGAASFPPERQLSIIPPHMHIPDLYAVDLGRDPMPIAEPIDNDRLFSIDLLPRARRGWMPALVYDEESPRVLGRSSTVLRLSVEFEF